MWQIPRDYYEDTLRNLTQPNCAKVATAFIKKKYPYKPQNFPYKGKEETRPEWWAPGVKHIEPNRLCKEPCINLLVHIICKLDTSTEMLAEVAGYITDRVESNLQLEIIYEVFRVRRMEVLYEEERARRDMAVSFGYCDDDKAMALNTGKAFNESLQIVPSIPNEQAIMAIPTTTPYPLQDSFHSFGVQPEYPLHEAPYSNFFSSSPNQLDLNRGTPDRDALFGAVDGIVRWYTKVMGKTINRPFKTLEELYKCMIGSLDPTESQEILRQWNLAIQSEISHLSANDWPPKKETPDTLFWILCGSRNLTLGRLNTFLQESSVSPSTKRILRTIIVLRKYQLEKPHQQRVKIVSARLLSTLDKQHLLNILH